MEIKSSREVRKAPKKKVVLTLIALYGIENKGVRMISAMLKSSGYQTNVILFKTWINNRLFPPREREIELLVEVLKKTGTDIVGISLLASFFKIATTLTQRIKESLNIPVVWGGLHPTTVPEECIEIADIICIGEGEYPMRELVEKISRGEKITDILSLWIRTPQGIFKNRPRLLNQKLDSLPFPDYENSNKFWIERKRLHHGEPLEMTAEYRIYPSRGCSFRCSYCYNSILRNTYKNLGRYYRHRSVENVIAELVYAKKRFKRIRRIKFDGDTFLFPEEWVAELCQRYPREVNIPFEIMLEPSVAQEKLLWDLKRAGMTKVQMGIESGSEEEAREVFGRRGTNAMILNFAQLNKRLRLDTVYDVIMDDPLSTTEDKERLFEFIMSLPRPFKLYLYSLNFFPKTALTQKLLKMGLISAEDIEGRATKAHRQFRLSLDYPRPKEELFWVSLLILATKNFIPKWFVNRLSRSKFLFLHPQPLKIFAQVSNFIKIFFIALQMSFRGEFTRFKLRQYGNFRALISQ